MSRSTPARLVLVLAAAFCTVTLAKLPAPSDEAKAKAAEAAAKSAWGDKVAAYQLCKSQDAVAAGYHAGMKKAGKDAKQPVATPACTDPGPFVYSPSAPSPATSVPAKP